MQLRSLVSCLNSLASRLMVVKVYAATKPIQISAHGMFARQMSASSARLLCTFASSARAQKLE
jgi:hypothetical protein